MKSLLTTLLTIFSVALWAQPTFTTSPTFPSADQMVTLTVDASTTSLEGYTGDVWLWAWLPDCSADCDAPTNVNPATAAQDAAKVTRSSTDQDVYSISFTPTAFFDKTAAEITRIGFKLKSVNWDDGIETDIDLFFDISSGNLEVSFLNPSAPLLFVDLGETITIDAASSLEADLSLSIDGAEVHTSTSTTINYEHLVVETGTIEVVVAATSGGSTVTDSFMFLVRGATPNQPLPAGVIKGINYPEDNTTAVLSLEAPGKSSVYVIGEFNGWMPSTTYQMKKDGDLFWIELSGLTPGEEYAFQYLVDESIKVADPYADKVLDPDNDSFISNATYPDLKPYPTAATGIVSVLQTNRPEYNWQVTDFVAPPKDELVIYELLVRDFDEGQNYQEVIARLDYLQTLGVNAIELMPVTEFDGNLSWGYNPSFFFALDKYYGTREAFKEFVDECHSRGIAVILDMVLNHTHEDNPLAQLYWDAGSFIPSADNPWLNQEARHPFNVFYDFNHESTYTQAFVDTVNYYWLEEYKLDGYRFDLTKGFTQDFTAGSDVGAWSSYNQTRIDLLKRMVDELWADHPDAYVIFEHLADNSEEKVLADYGIMLWGNMNHNYNQLTMGHPDNSNIDWSYYGTRNWNEPNLIAYMESHDEERLVYRNSEFGNTSNGGHNTKNLNIAVERVKSASAIYYAIPGAKMIWQFGELGYDKSIELNGRTGEKPIPWASADDGLNYDANPDRLRLYKVTAELVDLKTSYNLFNTSDFSLDESQTLVKQIVLKNDPYVADPVTTQEMNAVVIGNFNVSEVTVNVDFPHEGTWYHYFANGDELTVSGSEKSIDLAPGEFRIYTDVKLEEVESELTLYTQPNAPLDLSADEVAGEGVQLKWQDNSEIETSYKIYRTASEEFELIATIASSSTSYLDTDAMPNTRYTYKVEAANRHYASESNEISISTTDIITSTGSEISNPMVVYPNPTNGSVVISGGNESTVVTVFSLSGEKVLEETLFQQKLLHLDQLKDGIYILSVVSGENKFTNRLIKLSN